MSEEIKNTETTETKETKRPRGKKANAQTTEQVVEHVVEQREETIVEEIVETEVVEQLVEDTSVPQTTEQPVEQHKETIVEQPAVETFDIHAIKREAIRYNHCVFTYSDGFICHAVSRSKADVKHNAWLNRK